MRFAAWTIVAVLAATTMRADEPKGLTAEQINEAIAAAANKKQLGCYPLEPRSSLGPKVGNTVGCVSTQYSRVVAAAREAATAYKAFGPADVTADVLGAPGEIRVMGFALSFPKRVSSVRTIVILPKGSKDPKDAVQPTSTSDVPEVFKNGFGATFEGKSLAATFPASALRTGEIHVVYDDGEDWKIAPKHVLSKGMSLAEVESLLGAPDPASQRGPKSTYLYGAGKVVATDGKVTDIKW